MERKPLDSQQIFLSKSGPSLSAKPLFDGKYHSEVLRYDMQGRYMGKTVSGVLIEYFPDDKPGRYLDIQRNKDGNIDVGYLSKRDFDAGRAAFIDYYKTMFFFAEKNGADMSKLRFFDANNTVYVCIFDDVIADVKNTALSRAEFLDFITSLANSAADFTASGAVMQCDIFVNADNKMIPIGIYRDCTEITNTFDENLNEFGSCLFYTLFGRYPVTSDRRCFARWQKPENELCKNLSEDDFNILCDILRLSIQVTRRNCVKSAEELLEKLSALK